MVIMTVINNRSFNGLSIDYVSSIVLSGLSSLSLNAYESPTGQVYYLIPSLQMRKLRIEEVETLLKDTKLESGRAEPRCLPSVPCPPLAAFSPHATTTCKEQEPRMPFPTPKLLSAIASERSYFPVDSYLSFRTHLVSPF